MAVTIPIELGDIIYTGRFKNKKQIVKKFGKDKYGHPTVNGKSMLTFRLVKTKSKQKKSTISKIAYQIIEELKSN